MRACNLICFLNQALLLLVLFHQPSTFDAFVVPSGVARSKLLKDVKLAATSQEEKDMDSPVDELSEERKQNLFQFLLRDLQVEGVPLLGVNADKPYIMQAALWTTMAQLCENPKADKACMIFEQIPIPALSTFVDTFMSLKSTDGDEDLELPELGRFNVSLVGKGVGPAILISTGNITDSQSSATALLKGDQDVLADQWKWESVMKTFVSRMIVDNEVCPHIKDNAVGPSGLDGVEAGPLGYRLSGSLDAFDIMSAFWNCICELQTVPEEQLSSTILSFKPPTGYDTTTRFAAVSGMIQSFLKIDNESKGEFNLMYMYPTYDRQLIQPIDEYIPGHLPPVSWLRPILQKAGHDEEASKLTDEELGELQNYERRSPLPAIVIKRVSQLAKAAKAASADEEEKLTLDTVVEKTSKGIAKGKITTYANNMLRMMSIGKEKLQSSLESEMEQTK